MVVHKCMRLELVSSFSFSWGVCMLKSAQFLQTSILSRLLFLFRASNIPTQRTTDESYIIYPQSVPALLSLPI